MLRDGNIWVATKASGEAICLIPQKAHRHGLISGADNAEVDSTARVLAEGFSSLAVPVLITDVNRNLAGMAAPGEASESIQDMIAHMGSEKASFSFQGFPVTLWDIYGKTGIPLCATVSEIGPVLMSQLLNLNIPQRNILKVIYHISGKKGFSSTNITDLKAVISYIQRSNSKIFSAEYGEIKSTVLDEIFRSLVVFENGKYAPLIGEPALNILDLMRVGPNGKGVINVLDANLLVWNSNTYSVVLLWLLSKLSELMPDVDNLSKPKLVIFIDEARLLFKDNNSIFIEITEHITKSLQKKGIAIFFCTQKMQDIPGCIFRLLGTKIQHSSNAYTTAQLKEVRNLSNLLRPNPSFDTFEALVSLTSGEALFSIIKENDQPSPIEKGYLLPPQSCTGPISDKDRERNIKENPLYAKYSRLYDSADNNFWDLKATIKDKADKIKSDISKPNLEIIMGSKEANPFIYDLGKMPHLFISGVTGSGKTSYVENLILELMTQNSPENIQFLIYTSKETEYTVFYNSPFMLENPLSEPDSIRDALETLVALIEYRFSKVVNHKASPSDSDVFVVIDDASFITKHEWANTLLSRIIQDGRIAKIHLILVTSTPHRSDIPSGIRDRIPCRIAFCTTTTNVSRIIIGTSGAEKLLVPGELIFKSHSIFVKLKSPHFSYEEMWEMLHRNEESRIHWSIQTKTTYEDLKGQRKFAGSFSPSSMPDYRDLLNKNVAGSNYNSDLINPQNHKETVNIDKKRVLLTPQDSIKGSTIRVKVDNNNIVVQKKLTDGTKAKMHIGIGAIQCFRHHKPTFFRKGYIGIELKQKASPAFTYNNNNELNYKAEVKEAFSKELNSRFVKIEYADHKEARFKKFINLLAKDSGISLYEE